MSHIAFVCLFALCQPKLDETRIASPVKSFVQEIAVQQGDRVSAGQILMRLDDRLAVIDLRLAEANINYAQANCEVARATVAEAASRADTKRRLHGEGRASKEELDAANLMREKVAKEVLITLAQLEIARLNTERARIIVDRHVIRAPVAGVVEELTHTPGEAVAELEIVVRIRRKAQE